MSEKNFCFAEIVTIKLVYSDYLGTSWLDFSNSDLYSSK